jgi:hypothetical protein
MEIWKQNKRWSDLGFGENWNWLPVYGQIEGARGETPPLRKEDCVPAACTLLTYPESPIDDVAVVESNDVAVFDQLHDGHLILRWRVIEGLPNERRANCQWDAFGSSEATVRSLGEEDLAIGSRGNDTLKCEGSFKAREPAWEGGVEVLRPAGRTGRPVRRRARRRGA